MKRTGFLSLTLLFVFAGIYAQRTFPTAEERANLLTEWMKSNLQLNDNQVSPVHEINLKYANKTQELLGSSQTRMQKKRMLKADSNAKEQELKRIFTSEQFNTYLVKKDEIRKKMREKMKEKANGSQGIADHQTIQ